MCCNMVSFLYSLSVCASIELLLVLFDSFAPLCTFIHDSIWKCWLFRVHFKISRYSFSSLGFGYCPLSRAPSSAYWIWWMRSCNLYIYFFLLCLFVHYIRFSLVFGLDRDSIPFCVNVLVGYIWFSSLHVTPLFWTILLNGLAFFLSALSLCVYRRCTSKKRPFECANVLNFGILLNTIGFYLLTAFYSMHTVRERAQENKAKTDFVLAGLLGWR